jgi:hypothetical protein
MKCSMMTLIEISIPISMHLSIYFRTMKEFIIYKFREKSNKMAVTQRLNYVFALRIQTAWVYCAHLTCVDKVEEQ